MATGPNDNPRYADERYAPEIRRDESYGYEYEGYDRDWPEDEYYPERDRRKSSDLVRAEIDRTRSELDQTIDALQERLSPQELIHAMFGAFRENAGDAVQGAVRVVRDNPVPAALIGLGLIWLVASQVTSKSKRKKSSTLATRPDVEYYEYDEYEGYGHPMQSAI